jgi:hypothetical protein
MEFNVPQAGSSICHINVYPKLPQNGAAQEWRLVNTSLTPNKEVDSLNIQFALASTPQERQSERMILVFSMTETVQTPDTSWRFSQGGLMYCEGQADVLDDMDFVISNNGKLLTATVKCLTDLDMNFNFSLMALHKDNGSGECRIFGSSDPGGTIIRR